MPSLVCEQLVVLDCSRPQLQYQRSLIQHDVFNRHLAPHGVI